MPVTAGVGRAHEDFAASIMEFEIVGYLFTAGMVTKEESIWRMLKQEVFHRFPRAIQIDEKRTSRPPISLPSWAYA